MTAILLSEDREKLQSVYAEHMPQTRGMLDYSLFSQMLPDATFLNTGRGAQVVEEDLIAVLKNRPDLTAVLDVTYPEPPLLDSQLYSLPNCILTPHIAGSSGNEVRRMARYMTERNMRGLPGASPAFGKSPKKCWKRWLNDIRS